MILHVRLTPRASADRIDGWAEGPDGRPVLAVRVRAQPIEGEANAALEALLAKTLGVRKSAVRVTRGGSSRLKAVEIDGLDQSLVEQTLGKT
jgi:uncharacterized protein YggU (UPF0235/DUF167 family)